MKKRQHSLVALIATAITSKIELFLLYITKIREFFGSFWMLAINRNNLFIQLARIDKPAPIFLAAAPALWSVALAAQDAFQIVSWCLFFLTGAFFMRSAGCVINDIVDKDIDRHVERTKNRPLACGLLKVSQALKLLVFLLSVSALMLVALPKAARLLSIALLLPIVAYPFLKRFTYYPQILLGFTFNAGTPIAWACFDQLLSLPSLLLYCSCILWTIGYDTIYAYQDRDDDIKLHLKSTAIKFGTEGSRAVWNLYWISLVMICFAGACVNMNIFFYLLMIPALFLLYSQSRNLDKETVDFAAKFKSNVDFALIVFIAILLGRF